MTKLSKSSIIAAIIAFAYSGLGSWRPSFWTDEAATLSAVRRSFPDLVAMLGNIDAVHGAYYFIMFGWTRIFGFSEVSVRLPSLLAVAVSALLMVEIGRKVANLHVGFLAAAFLVLLPRVQYAATDGRSYALTLLGAVAATYVLVSIRENPRRIKWAAYSVVGVVSVSLSFYCVLLLLAHAVSLLWDRVLRKEWGGMLTASLGWILPAAFVGIAASRQQFQISWIRDVGPAFPFEFTFLQFFADGYFAIDGQVVPAPTPGEDLSMVGLAIFMWTAAAIGVVLCRRNFLVRLAVPWLIGPAAVVVIGSLVSGGNYYLPRYLTFELPAMALLAAAPAAVLPAALTGTTRKLKVAIAAAVAVVLVVCLPSYAGQRTQFGRDREDDFRFVADSVQKLGTPGDSFVLSPASDLAYQAYPEAFAGLGDPTIGITAAEWKRIFNQRFDVKASADRIRQYRTVILIEKSRESAMADALQSMGYFSADSQVGPSTTVTKYILK